jgi:hypothetical protein
LSPRPTSPNGMAPTTAERDLQHLMQAGGRQLGGHAQRSPHGRVDVAEGDVELEDVAEGRGKRAHAANIGEAGRAAKAEPEGPPTVRSLRYFSFEAFPKVSSPVPKVPKIGRASI